MECPLRCVILLDVLGGIYMSVKRFICSILHKKLVLVRELILDMGIHGDNYRVVLDEFVDGVWSVVIRDLSNKQYNLVKEKGYYITQ